ncbi:endonuclease/exonuclease/phosphatase family protein [Marivirga sp.]|uniref:endonuclease/exonuclease/phosphatase family protein n=1 Tax=Marivirga sp. TaxID=2018662 RepID=UPI002D7E324F|nr:endonuclease/exonuclease/phosphatase family protein [Marivirga sp.]HET8860080.1 endonuclease/exonuclease/phosphatase family protein [Marivirga sp.]
MHFKLVTNLKKTFIAFFSIWITISQFAYSQEVSSLVLWDFNHSNSPAGNSPWFNPIPANQGGSELSFTFSIDGDRPATSFAGSDLDQDGFTANGTGGSLVPQGTKENGKHFQFEIDSRGYQNLILSYATRGTSSGFQTQTWFTSVNGGEWVQVAAFTGITSEYELRTINLADYQNIESLGVRCVLDGATSDSGNNRFDNLRLTGELETLPLQLSTNEINFTTPTALASFSNPESFIISGLETNAVLQISATRYFELSEAANGTYATTLSIAPENLVNDKQIFVRFAAPSSAISGQMAGNISFNLDPSQSITVNAQLEGEIYGVPYQEDFNNPDLFTLPNWQRFQEIGEQNWVITDENRIANNPYSARMNGYTSAPQDNRTWLISPAIQINPLSADEFLIMNFESRSFFANGTPVLKVFASTNYDRSANPTDPAFTWTELPASFPLETGIWQNTREINLTSFSDAENISFAIVYESASETDGAAEWMVDNFEVNVTANAPEPIITTNNWSLEDYYFGVLAPGASSNARLMTLTAANLLSPLTLTADPGIEISLGENFSSQLTLSQADFPESGNLNIQTRMTASEDETVLAQAGSITLSTEGTNDTTFGYFNHATVGKDATFDVVTWNIEWFGDPTNATTSNTDLQRRRVRQLIEELDADVYAFQEITSIPVWNLLVAELENYEGILSPAVSGSDFESAQKLAFLFKKSTVDTLQTKVLLNNINEDALTNFPVTNKSLFWASGRYPFSMDITATIGGIERDLTIVNIHGRSNGGGESADVPRYQLRRYDVEVLYDSLQEYYANKSVIVMGDYNDDILRTVAPTSEPTVPDNGESSYIKFTTDSDNYLGVSMPLSEAGLRSFVTRENVIDHVIINRNLFDDHILGAERVVIPYSSIPDFNTTTSDHFPVEARFLLSGEPVLSNLAEIPSSTMLYPNPSKGIIYFKNFKNIQQVDVWSVTGTKLAEFRGAIEQIDLSNLRAGVYLIKIISKSGQEVKRIILE